MTEKNKFLITSLWLCFSGMAVWDPSLLADETSAEIEPQPIENSVPQTATQDHPSIENQFVFKDSVKIKTLAERFKVPESTVENLRRNQKMGWGEISHLLAIANKSGQNPETILDLRKSGMGWGNIAKKYDLRLGEVKKETNSAKQELKRAEKLSRRAQRMQQAAQNMERKSEHLRTAGYDQTADKFEQRGERLRRHGERLQNRAEHLKNIDDRMSQRNEHFYRQAQAR